MPINGLYYCIHLYIITIYCWSLFYECSVLLYTPLQYIVDHMIINVLCQCIHHYNMLLISLLLMFRITVYNITIYIVNPIVINVPLSLSTSLQYIVDHMLINVLYHCLCHYSILLIPWLLMFCITVYTIAIYCWSHNY